MKGIAEQIKKVVAQTELDRCVSAYLLQIGEYGNALGETYEESAERLDDDVMREAASRWWELESL